MFVLSVSTAPIAKIADKHCDMILVGDSLGMTIYGFDNTLPVTLSMMIQHGKAVAQQCHHSLTVVDMPFGSVELGPEHALKNAIKLLKETNAQAVKIEGGIHMVSTIKKLVEHGIAVMGHVGLLPQYIHQLGGYKIQGYQHTHYQNIIEDAKAIADAGVFAIVIEGVIENLARDITQILSIPTIGIGASPECDGQILVVDDVIGLNDDKVPKFVKKYANSYHMIDEAIQHYSEDVINQHFPNNDHIYLP